ncbi:glycosyltransferase [filamentous cyanobacterium LEGE 11480]|uniref:Glycosyltransferase n=1 Tax=Romeriopsis navalis LEGE 11480 TaxID=2777977 RepID=A0A928VLM7_9CYAN|nr:glycosyltransferase [Romeriopsis navalis LEGE 11480]
MPFVSVIIPIYNGEDDLPDLLDCLRAQTYPLDRIEFLLVDNGSHDRTWEILQATDDITALREAEIRGSYAARNCGIVAAQGSLLAFTDADCRPEPQWLLDLVAGFNDPSVGIVVGEIQALPGNSLLERYADRQETLSQKHTLANAFRPYGQTANVGIRASIFQEIDLFRPHLTTGGDADICWRILQETAWEYVFADSAIVRHRHRRSFDELLSQWRRYGRSNQYLHDIHGIALMEQPSLSLYGQRLLRWLLKELPIAIVKLLLRRADSVDLVSTPIGLLCLNARWQGQKQATLPAQAKNITPYPTGKTTKRDSSHPVTDLSE